jgi:hypothetical protein
MAQIFHRSSNSIAKASIIGGVLFLGMLLWSLLALNSSPFATHVHVAREQPVPFSHKHHVAGLGIDCRYCHTTVEDSPFAGIPPTKTCMTCHSILWNESPALAPVRESYAQGKPIVWTRVHDVPDFVYFDHSIHINKGIGCVSCHGQVDQMPLIAKEHTLHMAWCLDCHRNPAPHIRPREAVFDPTWESENQQQLGAELMKAYNVQKMENCSVCHR